MSFSACLIICMFFLLSGTEKYANSESVEELFATINNDGFPLDLLVKAADLETSQSRQLPEDKTLSDILEMPDVRKTAQTVALYYAAKHLLNSSESSRALLMFNWADRGLCKYQWLSWLPWLACQTQEQWIRQNDNVMAGYTDEALPVGECYSDAKE